MATPDAPNRHNVAVDKPITVGADVIAVHQRDLSQASASAQPGKADFEAVVRKVDRIDPSWRE